MMKIKNVFLIITLMMGFILMPQGHAISPSDIESQSGISGTKTENTYDLKVTSDDAKYDIVIESGEVVTLDLDGHKLQNYTENNSVVHVKNGGKLILKDSKNTGEISVQNNADGAAPIIKNEGTMEMHGGKIISSRKGSVGILNTGTATLTITGGTIDAQGEDTDVLSNASWAITNQGTATISGGTFIQGYQVSAIQNEKDLTIEGGIFQYGEGSTHFSMITNNVDTEPTLSIEGGTFNTDSVLSSNGNNDNTIITGGEFQNPEKIKSYVPEGYELENGKVVLKELPSDDAATDDSKNPDTSDIPLSLFLVLIAISGCGITYMVKRQFN